VAGCCEQGNELSGCIQLGISRLAGELTASHKGFCSEKSVCWLISQLL
jgi:hypothetical protein